MKVERVKADLTTPVVAGGVYASRYKSGHIFLLSRCAGDLQLVDCKDGTLYDIISEETLRSEFIYLPNAKLVIEE